MAMVEWKDAVSTRFAELVVGLEVSSLGEIRKKSTGFLFKSKDHKDGYPCIKRKNKTIYRHQLVAETFIGARPEGMVIDHIDNDKENNCVQNLRYVSPSENKSKGMKTDTPPQKIPRHYKENLIRNQESLKVEMEKLTKKVEYLEKALYETNGFIAYVLLNPLQAKQHHQQGGSDSAV